MVKTNSLNGLPLLCGICLISLTTIFCGRFFLEISERKINPNISESELWKYYRWSIDPNLRRKASLTLVAKSKGSFRRRKRLLQAQGWGNSPLAAVVIKLQAQTHSSLGQVNAAKNSWKNLLNRFPEHVSTADAYYFLGKKKPELRLELLSQQPAHPAALAAALELGEHAITPYQAAIHLARWGPSSHGAEKIIREACSASSDENLSSRDRQVLARALAYLGDGVSSLNCLSGEEPSEEIYFLIIKALMQHDSLHRDLAKETLENLIRDYPDSSSTKASLREFGVLLAEDERLLKLVNPTLFKNSPGFDVAKSLIKAADESIKEIHPWMKESDLWHIQWNATRKALLNRDWSKARSLLSIFNSQNLPQSFAVRQQFWLGFLAEKQGRIDDAKRIWEAMLKSYPSGYYTWRAKERLKKSELSARIKKKYIFDIKVAKWHPLGSKNNLVNQLWQLGLNIDALEAWISLNPALEKTLITPEEMLVEGRLRMSVENDWIGLRKLFQASLLLKEEGCETREILHRSQYPYRYSSEVQLASLDSNLKHELILAVVKEESRFAPSVQSSAGAIGLMQLMPETANEVNQSIIDRSLLFDPKVNILLGSKYLSSLLKEWDENLLLAIASYNAGPANVKSWITEEIKSDPELWVERIPYPETRFYTKKVFGNFWAYLNLDNYSCIK